MLNRTTLDAAESAFFARQLEFIAARTYDQKFPPLKARRYIPVNNQVDNASETYTFRAFSQFGVAKLLATYADDLPSADIKGQEFSVQIRGMGIMYRYGLDEIRKSAKTGVDLDGKKATAARRGIEVLIDQMGFAGDGKTNAMGLSNIPNAGSFAVPAGGGGSTLWANKTPLEILADLNGIENKIVVDTNENELPDTLLLPLAQYQLIATTPMSATIPNVTILEYFLRTSQYVKNVDVWNKLVAAGAGGLDRMICYRRDPEAVELIIPQEFEQFPPQQEGLAWEVPCHARCAGVVSYYPLSISYGDGI
jgi:hypothetical protein